MSNAIKFTESGGVALRVSTIGPDDDGRLKLRFEVEDTGVGIGLPACRPERTAQRCVPVRRVSLSCATALAQVRNGSPPASTLTKRRSRPSITGSFRVAAWSATAPRRNPSGKEDTESLPTEFYPNWMPDGLPIIAAVHYRVSRFRTVWGPPWPRWGCSLGSCRWSLCIGETKRSTLRNVLGAMFMRLISTSR